MYHFKGIESFFQFSEHIELSQWHIEKQLLTNRVEKYCKLDIFKQMKSDFETKQLSIWPLKDEEIITWLDTQAIMRRLLMKLFKKGTRQSLIHIFIEYPLVYGNHMRTDYLIVYDRLIVILEFGMFNQDERRSEERYTKKLQESISHAQLLRNMIDSSSTVVNYVMIYKPEFDRIVQESIRENIVYNNNEINQLANFLHLKITEQDHLQALYQLDYLSKL
jgi:hypothetical protein